MIHAFGIKGRKQMMPGKDGTATIHELPTLNKMCGIKLHFSKALGKKASKPEVQGQNTFSQKKVLLETSKYFTLLNARQYN